MYINYRKPINHLDSFKYSPINFASERETPINAKAIKSAAKVTLLSLISFKDKPF